MARVNWDGLVRPKEGRGEGQLGSELPFKRDSAYRNGVNKWLAEITTLSGGYEGRYGLGWVGVGVRGLHTHTTGVYFR